MTLYYLRIGADTHGVSNETTTTRETTTMATYDEHYSYFASRYGAHRTGILGAIAKRWARKDAAYASKRGHVVGHGAIRATGVPANPYAKAVSEFRSEKAQALKVANPVARAELVYRARVRFATNLRSIRTR